VRGSARAVVFECQMISAKYLGRDSGQRAGDLCKQSEEREL